jgi:hypothetical protein
MDVDDRLKLIDLDHALNIGEDLDVGDDPYVRVHRAGELLWCGWPNYRTVCSRVNVLVHVSRN